jgi:hypothetical protein
MIVNALKANPLWFGQLLRALSEGTGKVATERELESEGIISRTTFGKRGERVESSSTALTGHPEGFMSLDLPSYWHGLSRRQMGRLCCVASWNTNNHCVSGISIVHRGVGSEVFLARTPGQAQSADGVWDDVSRRSPCQPDPEASTMKHGRLTFDSLDLIV